MTTETNYYNDNDPKAAHWLRSLIKAGLIPDGFVDERSIADVQGSDLKGFFHSSGRYPRMMACRKWIFDPAGRFFRVEGLVKGRKNAVH